MKQLQFDNQKKQGSVFMKLIKWGAIAFVAWFALTMLTFMNKRLAGLIFIGAIAYGGYRIYKFLKPKVAPSVNDNNRNNNEIQINGTTTIENPYAGVFISGGAGSGKSKSLVEPIIKQAGRKGFTGVIYDFKFPELAKYVNTAYENSDITPYYVNFSDLNRSHRINPIAPELMKNESYAREFAFSVLANLNTSMISKPDFWSDNSVTLLSAVFWYLRCEHPQYCTLPHAIAMVLQPDFKALLHTLMTNQKCSDMVAPLAMAYMQGADNQLAGQVTSLQVALAKINSNELYYLLTGSDFSLELNDSDKKGILVLGNDPTLTSTYAPVIGLILTSVSKQLNRQDKEKSVFLMDEFPTVFVPNVEQLPATARSNKVATILACQDISQIVDKYGKEKADTILSNLGNQFYGRTPNPLTAKRVSDIFGKAEKQVVSQNEERGLIFNSHKANTYSTRETDIVKAQDVANLNTGSFYTILAEGRTRQGLSNIPMDSKFTKTDILPFKSVTEYDLQRAYDNVKYEVSHILVKIED
ncbi:type IV secretory system conjugative DNA transfer family protein [Myroides sp. WP-1]|uniref:type IV secretory system conjugative DNA transfer family protein n=1 Tax=Myroides sp. WP-1 TaxID=2759944 RepID=UPI0015FBF3B4|nr:type IV secretory system conjugative DNA transfer family protein [Myroides sp. WP-1]MBB1140970.1 type IV secretion system DNA-binding domain-containing protein [Myroides sp. WP-1]